MVFGVMVCEGVGARGVFKMDAGDCARQPHVHVMLPMGCWRYVANVRVRCRAVVS